jgi:UDP-N-acetylmuramoylalanine--D-glutamate ligase
MGYCVRVLNGDDTWPSGSHELCVTSPGIPLDHNWQISARSLGVRVISELQLGVEQYRTLGGRMLAVTGSKGKSSVVKLVANAVNGIPCGNYGKPICEVVLDSIGDNSISMINNKALPVAVVEVSSFQMETTNLSQDTFEAAAILNLQEDHLDRHGSLDTYHSLKKRLLDYAQVKIIGTDFGSQDQVGNAISHKDTRLDLIKDSYFDNPILRSNALCAIALMRAVGLDDSSIRDAFLHFEPLSHRMQTVGIFDGITWIDDSKATSISALIAGVSIASSLSNGSAPKVRLIAGGLPKGDDPRLARNCLLNNVAKVYLIGKCATLFQEAWKDVVPCEICETMQKAVAISRKESKKGDFVLLSPGTASFDQFKSYGERGDHFAELARSYDS